jgi:adenine-specific DNA-methyltransferase
VLPGDNAELRKARGAFFTPTLVAGFIATWAIQSPDDAVLEPSCGEAVFLREAGRGGGHTGPLVGVELHASSAGESERTLHAEGIKADIHVGDFFLHTEFGCYDAAIGNPPYVRYQDFSGEPRARARAAALQAGVSLPNLASSWAAFAVHSALHLKKGGRLGLVLPAELLTVNYAAGVRQFLMEHFSEVELVLFEERVFPGVLEEVVLLLAGGYDPEGVRGTGHMTIWPVRDAAGLADLSVSRRWTPPTRSAKWSGGLMSAGGLMAYDRVATADGFTVLETWGATTLGMVTGNNRFFALSPARVVELGLKPPDVIRVSPPGSRHLRSLALTVKASTSSATAGRLLTYSGPLESRPRPPGGTSGPERTSMSTRPTSAACAIHGGVCPT